jgi:hypothetical protein
MRLLPQDGQSRITLGEPGSGWWVCGMAHLHPEPPSGDWDKPGGGFDRVLGAGQAPEAADLMQGITWCLDGRQLASTVADIGSLAIGLQSAAQPC